MGTPLRQDHTNSAMLLEKQISMFEQEKLRVFQQTERDKRSWMNLHEILRQENVTLQQQVKSYQKVIEN